MYGRLAASLGVSGLAMHALSYSEIDVASHFHLSLSNGYMTLMMVAAMGLIMLTVMREMFGNARLNAGLYAGFALLLVGAFLLGRTQALVGDDAFLRSMIPHHSRAILVCQEAELADPQIMELCAGIIETQREEIREMEAIIERRG
jgi:uncharacterized protein (DUF305 family)